MSSANVSLQTKTLRGKVVGALISDMVITEVSDRLSSVGRPQLVEL